MTKLWLTLFVGAAVPLYAGAADPDEPSHPPPTEATASTLAFVDQEAAPATAGQPRFWCDGEFVLWWLREGRIPTTLTTSSAPSQGLLGQPDTQILYGNDRQETRHGDRFNGLRFTLGYSFRDDDALAVEANAFFLERDSTHFRIDSSGSLLLARAYFHPDGSPASEIIAGPAPDGPRSGSFVGYSRIELFGQEANMIALLFRGDNFRVEAVGGARFLQMRDRTDNTSSGLSLPDRSTLFGLTDHYRTFNEYYGGQGGLRGELTAGRWSLDLRGVIGPGANVEKVRTFGDRNFQSPVIYTLTPGGLTVQPGNAGVVDRAALNMVTEAGLNIGYQLTPLIRLHAGYTFLLWDGALRSGDQIDLVVNPIAGTVPARPAIPFKGDVLWAQGLNLGLSLSW